MLLAIFHNPKDTFDNCGVCGGKAIQVLAYLLNDGAKEVYKTYTAKRASSNAHVSQKPCFTKHLSTAGQKHAEVQVPNFKGYKSLLQHFSATQKLNYYIRGLKPSVCKKIFEQLRRTPDNVRSNLIAFRRIAADKGRSQCALI